jgi:hypothetical protein
MSIILNAFGLIWSIYNLIWGPRRTVVKANDNFAVNMIKTFFDFTWNRHTAAVIFRIVFACIVLFFAVDLYLSVTYAIGPESGYPVINRIISIYKITLYPLFVVLFGGLTVYFFFMTGYYGAYAPIRIKNNTADNILVFVDGRRIGILEPGKQKRNNRALRGHDQYLIEIKNESSETIFRREYISSDLDKMEWRVTIPLGSGDVF